MPPTARQRRVVCAAPGSDVGSAQKYYVLQFNADALKGGQDTCVVRPDPKVPNAEPISFAAHFLAQVATPTFAIRTTAPLRVPVSGHASAVPAAAAKETKRFTIKLKPSRVRVSATPKP